MKILGASAEILESYQVIQPKDVQTSTAVVDFNAPGQRNKPMSWIWHSRDSSENDPSWLRECMFLVPSIIFVLILTFVVSVYRVNWLRAKSRRDRWAEEVELLKSELQWIKRYHQYQVETWEKRLLSCEEMLGFYARKQIKTWNLFQSQTDNALALIK